MEGSSLRSPDNNPQDQSETHQEEEQSKKPPIPTPSEFWSRLKIQPDVPKACAPLSTTHKPEAPPKPRLQTLIGIHFNKPSHPVTGSTTGKQRVLGSCSHCKNILRIAYDRVTVNLPEIVEIPTHEYISLSVNQPAAITKRKQPIHIHWFANVKQVDEEVTRLTNGEYLASTAGLEVTYLLRKWERKFAKSSPWRETVIPEKVKGLALKLFEQREIMVMECMNGCKGNWKIKLACYEILNEKYRDMLWFAIKAC